jgi:hypothetical protein
MPRPLRRTHNALMVPPLVSRSRPRPTHQVDARRQRDSVRPKEINLDLEGKRFRIIEVQQSKTFLATRYAVELSENGKERSWVGPLYASRQKALTEIERLQGQPVS